MEENNLWWGLIWIWEKISDFVLWADILTDLSDEKLITYQPQYEYNQGAEYETRNYCTLFSAFTMLSYLKNKQFLISDIKCVANKMILDWKLDPNLWAYLSDAIDYTRRWYNERNADKITSYSVDLTDKALLEQIKQKSWGLIQMWYRTSAELHTDAQDDWSAILWNYPKSWGHAVCKYGLNIIDNYFWKLKFNRYSFDKFDELITNWVVFRTWYIFLNA
jgi:hypothetical protein